MLRTTIPVRIALAIVCWTAFTDSLPAVFLVEATSLDPASPSLGPAGRNPADLMRPPATTLAMAAHLLGLANGFPNSGYDNVNSLALGDDPISTHVYFSVDRLTLGKPGTAVATASAADNAAAAIFRALPGNQSNAIELSNTDLGLTGGFFGDELDALAARNEQTVNRYFFTLDALSATAQSAGGALADDILVSPGNGAFTLFADGQTAIGLRSGDEIDALMLLDRGTLGQLDPGLDEAVFSLSPISPSTFTASGMAYDPGMDLQSSPADLLRTDFTGGSSLFLPAAALGLFPADNVDALAVPESAVALTWAALGVAILGIHASRRLRR